MKPKPDTLGESAFTRLDLSVLIAVLLLLVAIGASAVGGSRRATDLAACANNLRQVGRAFQVWGADHNGDWPGRTPMPDGGIWYHPLVGNAWFHYAWISNQLVTPRILVCPADTQKNPASHFGTTSDGGLLNGGYRNNAVSYFIMTDAHRFLPTTVFSGDRNVRPTGSGTCSIGATGVSSVRIFPVVFPFWTNNIHGLWGNLLAYDGAVGTYSDRTVTNATDRGDDNGILHLLIP